MLPFWRRLLSRPNIEQEIDREIQAHIEHKRDALIRDGLSAEMAERQARLAFGNTRVWREETREAWSLVWLEGLLSDLRFGWRTPRERSAVCVLCGGNPGTWLWHDNGSLQPDQRAALALLARCGTRAPDRSTYDEPAARCRAVGERAQSRSTRDAWRASQRHASARPRACRSRRCGSRRARALCRRGEWEQTAGHHGYGKRRLLWNPAFIARCRTFLHSSRRRAGGTAWWLACGAVLCRMDSPVSEVACGCWLSHKH